MSTLGVNEDHLPSLEVIERAAARVVGEVERVVLAARAEHERLAAAEEAGRAEGARCTVAHRLRRLSRLLDRAQASLVLPDDDRFSAAREIMRWLDQQDGADAPWQAEKAA